MYTSFENAYATYFVAQTHNFQIISILGDSDFTLFIEAFRCFWFSEHKLVYLSKACECYWLNKLIHE